MHRPGLLFRALRFLTKAVGDADAVTGDQEVAPALHWDLGDGIVEHLDVVGSGVGPSGQ
ncbi:MAG: hypothetical protein JO296_10865 [Pseudonocardiales bacterium]|nr:hypothetical protein [Pseudonocardiales bacterium]